MLKATLHAIDGFKSSIYNLISSKILSPKSVQISRFGSKNRAISKEIYDDYYPFTYTNLPEETIYIIDGTALLHSSYYSTEHKNNHLDSFFSSNVSSTIIEKLSINNNKELLSILSSQALRCGALVAMTMHFARFIRDIQPKYVVIAFDFGKKTFRNQIYPEYKQQRLPAPLDLLPSLILAPQVMEAFGCRCFSKEGFEADDIMASIGKWAKDRGLNVVHYCIDKDMHQLVEPKVHVMNPFNRELIGVEEVNLKYGLWPTNLCDFQALMGDAVDNIPGVAGIGQKTSSILIQYFGTVEKLYSELGLTTLNYEKYKQNPLYYNYDQLTSKQQIQNLQELLGADALKYSVYELQKCLKLPPDSKSKKPFSLLNKLMKCPYEEILKYKELVTLKTDISIHEIDYRIDNSNFFRYFGESRDLHRDSDSVENFISSISPQLK
eukprot:gene13068-17517_t